MAEFIPTIDQSAEVIYSVQHSDHNTEFDVNRVMVLMERRFGADHMKAAHARAHELHLERNTPVAETEPPRYKLIGREVGEYVGGMYRFYCYLAAWPISPAARSGANYAVEA